MRTLTCPFPHKVWELGVKTTSFYSGFVLSTLFLVSCYRLDGCMMKTPNGGDDFVVVVVVVVDVGDIDSDCLLAWTTRFVLVCLSFSCLCRRAP